MFENGLHQALLAAPAGAEGHPRWHGRRARDRRAYLGREPAGGAGQALLGQNVCVEPGGRGSCRHGVPGLGATWRFHRVPAGGAAEAGQAGGAPAAVAPWPWGPGLHPTARDRFRRGPTRPPHGVPRPPENCAGPQEHAAGGPGRRRMAACFDEYPGDSGDPPQMVRKSFAAHFGTFLRVPRLHGRHRTNL